METNCQCGDPDNSILLVHVNQQILDQKIEQKVDEKISEELKKLNCSDEFGNKNQGYDCECCNPNADSILTSVKKMLGITEEYECFDMDIVMHINSVLAILHQIGVGPDNGFSITDKSAVWTDFMPDDSRLGFVKTYVYMKVRLMFDTPQSSALIDAINKQISELEWRILVEVDKKE